jgi:F0F1-type ATP synthase membrane subunit b/b'
VDGLFATFANIFEHALHRFNRFLRDVLAFVHNLLNDSIGSRLDRIEGREKAVHAAEDLAKQAQETAHAGLDAAKHAGEVNRFLRDVLAFVHNLLNDSIGSRLDRIDCVLSLSCSILHQIVEVADQASALADQVADQASTAAASLREKVVDGAHAAADSLKESATCP